MNNPFKVSGNWYKGNLHTHTTRSDGQLSVDEIIDYYKKKGYDFLAITDHEIILDGHKYSQEEFVVIPGVEISVGPVGTHGRYEVLGIDVEYRDKVPRMHAGQEAIDFVKSLGGEAIIPHPYTFELCAQDLLLLDGFLGIEVYNHNCHIGHNKGISTVQWDDLLTRGRVCWGFAVDDAHMFAETYFDAFPHVRLSDYCGESDACGGWIMVKTSGVNRKEIISAIRKGLFYASTGPRIEEIDLDEIKQEVSVSCSPVKFINFACDGGGGRMIWKPKRSSDLLTEATFNWKNRRNPKYLRIECIDPEGKCAWTNPLLFR